jgi:hypothetical protein
MQLFVEFGGDKQDSGNPPTKMEVVEVREWLEIIEDDVDVLFAEEDEETRLFA